MPLEQNDAQGLCLCVCGVPGVGKSSLLNAHCENENADEQLAGSSVIKEILAPHTVDEFDTWPETDRSRIREESIRRLSSLRANCSGRLLVSGHFTLRNRASGIIEAVLTPADLDFYDGYVLVEATADSVLRWRQSDTRKRRSESREEIEIHAEAERREAKRCASLTGAPLLVIHEEHIGDRLAILSEFLQLRFPV